jgi:SAM-dependent methyltransferase
MASGASGHSDGIAWDWQVETGESDFYTSLARAVRRHLPAGARVLEIGVGCGYLLSQLQKQHHCRGVGLDLLPTAIDASRATAHYFGATLMLEVGSGFALPHPEGAFDVVMSFGLVEHFEPARTRVLLSEHVRVCRPGGLVIVSTPNSLDVCHSARKVLLGSRYPYFPERSYSPWGLARELRRVGLQPVGADGYAPLWSLRQIKAAYPLTAVLHKTGLLRALSQVSSPGLLSWIGNMTLQVAVRPPQQAAKTASQGSAA